MVLVWVPPQWFNRRLLRPGSSCCIPERGRPNCGITTAFRCSGGGGAPKTLPCPALENRRWPPQSDQPQATQDRRQANTSEPPARTTPHQRTNTPHSNGVSGSALFWPLWPGVCGPSQTQGSTLFRMLNPLRERKNGAMQHQQGKSSAYGSQSTIRIGLKWQREEGTGGRRAEEEERRGRDRKEPQSPARRHTRNCIMVRGSPTPSR